MTNFKIQPLSNRVLIKKDEVKEKTDGGLFLPEATKSEINTPIVFGRVMADPGPGITKLTGSFTPTDPDLKEGVRVVFIKNEGMKLDEIEKGLILIPEDKILAIVEDLSNKL